MINVHSSIEILSDNENHTNIIDRKFHNIIMTFQKYSPQTSKHKQQQQQNGIIPTKYQRFYERKKYACEYFIIIRQMDQMKYQ